MGRRLATLRRSKQLFAQHVATHLGAPESQIRGIERGGTEQGAPFHIHVQYADYLGVSLQDVFNGTYASPGEQEEPLPTTPLITVISQPPDLVHRQREGELIERLQEAIPQLEALGKPITTRTISQFVGLTRQGLQQNPALKALWEQTARELYAAREKCKQQREDELAGRVQEAIATLIALGQYPSQDAIGQLVRISPSGLRNQLPEEEGRFQRKQQAILHEHSLAEQVRKAMQQLHDRELPVSRQAVGELIGLTPRALAKYHLVRPLLSQIVEEYRNDRPQRAEQRESELLTQVQPIR